MSRASIHGTKQRKKKRKEKEMEKEMEREIERETERERENKRYFASSDARSLEFFPMPLQIVIDSLLR